MSNIYIQEPPTYGRVVLETTLGEIEIELWSREAPKTCRNFVQLVMEGYYNGTIFHRIIKGFMAQGGDPTGTGMGGDSIYGEPFKDEFHSRLRFNRRGLVAMANAGKDDNTSQFFFTFASAPELQNKHTIFGKVVGDTVFNMLKFEELEVDLEDRPVYPPKILKVKIAENPFPDIIPHITLNKAPKQEAEKNLPSCAAVKNYKLLSFGDEAEEDEEELIVVNKKFEKFSKSTHDLLDDPNLSCISSIEAEQKGANAKDLVEKVRQKLLQQGQGKGRSSGVSKAFPSKQEGYWDLEPTKSEKINDSERNVKSLNKDEAKHAYMKELDKYTDLKRKIPKLGAKREQETLVLLEKFKKNIEKTASTDEEKQSRSEEEEEWVGHTFKCFSGKLPSPLDKYNKFHEVNDEAYDLSDPRNTLNKRRREDSHKVIKSKINHFIDD